MDIYQKNPKWTLKQFSIEQKMQSGKISGQHMWVERVQLKDWVTISWPLREKPGRPKKARGSAAKRGSNKATHCNTAACMKDTTDCVYLHGRRKLTWSSMFFSLGEKHATFLSIKVRWDHQIFCQHIYFLLLLDSICMRATETREHPARLIPSVHSSVRWWTTVLNELQASSESCNHISNQS